MSDVDLSELERLALAAQEKAPGPYTIDWTDYAYDRDESTRGVDFIHDANGEQVIVGDSGVYPPHGPVARHIAANSPDVTIALVRRVRELEAEEQRLRSLWDTDPTAAAFRARDEAIDAGRLERAKVSRAESRIRSLEAALLKACDGWEQTWTSDNNDEPPEEIAQLRALAKGKVEE